MARRLPVEIHGISVERNIMNRFMRPAAAAGAAAVLALSLTACGGGAGSDAPTDASTDDFCGAYQGFAEAMGGSGGEDISEDAWNSVQDAIDEMAEVGTPEDISDEQRQGFEVFVNEISDLSYDDVKDASAEDEIVEVSEEDDAAVDEFGSYAGETCAEALTQ
jgi:hypothetical protein